MMTWKPLFPRHGTGTKTTRTVTELMGLTFGIKRKSLNFYEIRVRAIEKKDDITYTIS